MLNKKLLVVASTVVALVTSNASAKTEGSYAGIDILRNKVTVTNGATGVIGRDSDYNQNYQLGLNYKYAFNMNNVFVAPGVFVENTNISTTASTLQAKLNYRYGVKADLGYDIDNKLAAYLVGGLSFTDYATYAASSNAKKNGHKADLVYGVGLGYNYSEKVAFNLEWNRQSFKLKAPNGTVNDIKADVNVVKLGASYRF